MLTIQVSGADARGAIEALRKGLEELGAPTGQVEAVSVLKSRGDPVAVATLLLTIPPAIVACWDLAERIGKLKAVQRWLGRLPEGVSIVASDEEGRSVALGDGRGLQADAAALIELASEAEETPAWHVFLAYAGPDRELADQLYRALEARGVRTFMDRYCLGAAKEWAFELVNAQASARATVVLVSPNYERAWYQDEEIQRAIVLKRRWQRLLIPVYRDGRPSDPAKVPYGLFRLEPLDLPGAGGVQGAAAAIRGLLRDAEGA